MVAKQILFLLVTQLVLCPEFQEKYSLLVDNCNFVAMCFIRLCCSVKHMGCFSPSHYNLNSMRNACYFQRARNYMFILDHVPKIKYYSIFAELIHRTEFLNSVLVFVKCARIRENCLVRS